jgi:hypothetical protein
MATNPKNLPRMQRARAMPVARLVAGFCQNWPKGGILISQSVEYAGYTSTSNNDSICRYTVAISFAWGAGAGLRVRTAKCCYTGTLSDFHIAKHISDIDRSALLLVV